MTLPPIVERELRVASRRGGTYWFRFAGALFLMVVCFWSLLMLIRFQSPSVAARITFTGLSWWIFALAMLAGLRSTADCLSEEKREGTLGLLFLTDLKGRDIVLGKLVANSLRATYTLLSALPVLAIPVIVGGVGFGEFFRTALAQLNGLFFALSAGILASAFSRDDRRAAAAAFFVVVFFLGYYHLILGLLSLFEITWLPPDVLAWACPWYAFIRAGSAGHRLAAGGYWYPLLVSHLFGWGCLALGAWVLPGQWQDRPSGVLAGGWRARWRQWIAGDAAKRLAWRARWLPRNPFFWLVSRDRFQTLAVWAVLGLVALVWLGIALYDRDWLAPPIFVLTAIVLHSILKLWIASQAGYRFAHDRQSGALELLLSTPCSVKQIVRGQQLALLRQFLGPAIVVLLVDVVLHGAGQSQLQTTSEEEALWTATFVAGMVVFVADLVTMHWAGMWLGLTARRINTITGSAGLRVLVIPWLVWFVFVTFHILAGLAGNRGPQPWDLLIVWVVASLMNDAIWTVWCSRRLYREFRRRATDRYQPAKPAFWKRFPGRSRAVPGREGG